MDLSPIDLIHEDLQSVEDRMREIPFSSSKPVTESLEGLLAAGGKRLRPALALLFGRMLRVPDDPLFQLSASVEIVHTATLVHDDVVDQSSIRRGMPTVNARWSMGTAVLVGDFLFAWAARLAAATGSIAVMQKFAGALATIVDGEIRQISTSNSAYSTAEYEDRIQSKTAALFEVSCAGPALLVDDSTTAERAAEYGRSFGMAFQIADDILDFTADSADTGKPSGQDLRQGLVTLPAILFFKTHPADPDVSSFHSGSRDSNLLGRLIEKIRLSDAIEQSREYARRYIERAVNSMATFPSGLHRNALESLASSII
jgi:geranylgeranyl pyrophosphate synthase